MNKEKELQMQVTANIQVMGNILLLLGYNWGKSDIQAVLDNLECLSEQINHIYRKIVQMMQKEG